LYLLSTGFNVWVSDGLNDLIDRWNGQSCGGGRQRLWLARLGLVLHKRGSKSKLSVVVLKLLALLSNECFAKQDSRRPA